MSNAIKQTNDGFNSIYKGNFSVGINDVAYGGTAVTGFYPTTELTGVTELVTYIKKASDGPSIYIPTSTADNNEIVTGFNQYRQSLEGSFITTSEFTTTQNITILSGTTASTYPLEFNVAGIDKTTNFVTLTLGILSGDSVQNLGIVLVAPDNVNYSLVKGTISSGPVSTSGEISVNIASYKGVIDIAYPWDGYHGGDYNSHYTNDNAITFAAPCPLAPFSPGNYNLMNQFDNLMSGDTNGTWSLYIQDFEPTIGNTTTLLYAKLSFTFDAMMTQQDCLSWAASNNDIVVLNRDYPSIALDNLQLLIDPWYLPSANAYSSSPSVEAGNKINDLTNNNNDATPTNTINLQNAVFNSWYQSFNPFTFDTVTNIPAGNSSYTISVWFKTSQTNQSLVSFGTDTSYSANYLYINSGGYVGNYWCGTTITSTGGTINDNGFHNVVVTYDGTIATIYVDGSFNTDLTIGSSLAVSPTSNLEIGGGYLNDFQGNMGPVMIYSRALTSAEVLTNYTNVWLDHNY